MILSRRFFLFVLLLVVVSCNNPSKKTIFDDLSLEEIITLSERYKGFPMIYEEIEEIRTSPKLNTQEKVDFSGLTYEDFIDYHELDNDSTYWGKELQKFEEEWNKKYGSVDEKIDSVINYYNRKYEKEKLDNYVKIEPLRFEPYFKDLDSILIDGYEFDFRVTPLNGKIDKISFSFNLIPKNKSSDIFGSMDEINVNHFTPFTDEVNVFGFIVNSNYSDKWFRVLRDKKINDLLDDYYLVTKVTSLTVKGDFMFYGDFGELPYEIKLYNKSIEENDDSSYVGFRRERISKKLLKNDEYVSLTRFKEKMKDSILELDEKFNLVKQFEIMEYILENR